ncbi:pyridoxine/pyridoxamine 5'-phosphate oxidase [Prorops nasuta]|uniref:pyridoxine/pyridoxamine 5'-phosphate oxidase n=1 Tax=Prorops nasuta TaxID=863751 RepID=UPI0034CDEA1B
MDLFRTWKEEFKMYNPGPESLCLATVSKDCKVSARSVILRKLDEDGFVIVTDNRSRKVNDMDNNRNAAMCFLWTYSNDQQQKIVKQVRIEGEMVRLEKNEYQPLYDREPLYCKIRSKICYQGQQVEWNDLKARHDETLEKVYKKEINLAMPDHFVGYKMLPTMMDFYFARDHLIADRMVYKRLSKESSWTHNRVCA